MEMRQRQQLFLQFYLLHNIFQSESYRLMDFPKENNSKKRLPITNAFHYHLKTTTHVPTLAPSTPHNKGRVRIQQYEYDEQNLLGQGYTSKVYLGRSTVDFKSQFAIKVVDKRKISRTKQNLQLLKQEMHIHKQLDHPNIIKCYQIIEKGNFYYFILEYAPHGTLDNFIKKHQKLTESATISIMEQIIAAYRYLIQQKVLHRDLKPPNILKSGLTWKICDFGFSVMGKKNLVGEINVGTPAYMAPEALERTFYSPKTDIFSLGVLCHQMLFGQTPWVHKNQKVLLQIIKEQKINEENISTIKNKNLIYFLNKCCQPNDRRRMNLQEFESFDFWNDLDITLEKQKMNAQSKSDRFKYLNKTFCTTKEYPSTCHSQTSNNTSAVRSTTTNSDKKIPIQDLFKGNSDVLERELYYATIMYYLMKNNSYLLFEEAQEKQLFLSLLGKQAFYIIRRIKHTKINFFCLKKWLDYCNDKDYIRLTGQATLLQNKVQDKLNQQVKRKTITTIRHINKHFDELTYDKHLSHTCVNNIKQYLLALMTRVIKRYELNGQKYIKDNKWTGMVIDYLLKYYKYLGQTTSTTEHSRSIAIKKEYKDRGELIQNFASSKLDFQQFQSLKQQIFAMQT